MLPTSQMRRRLIHQKVGRIEEQFNESEARLSPPLRTAVVLKTSSPRKRKEPRDGSGDLLGNRVRHVARGLSRTVCILGRACRLDTGRSSRRRYARDVALAVLHGQHPREQFQQSRFARAVRADQHDALAAFDLEVHTAIHDEIAIRMIHVFQRSRCPLRAGCGRSHRFLARQLLRRSVSICFAPAKRAFWRGNDRQAAAATAISFCWL